jgi:hypothetical protein
LCSVYLKFRNALATKWQILPFLQLRGYWANITQDYVLESIFSAMERCKQADSFNATGVFKGAELLGKHLGMFQGENQGVTVNLPFDGWQIERTIVYPDTQGRDI